MVFADYEADWQNLSFEHEEISNSIERMLESYSKGHLNHLSYAIIGTFGVGKTQFLYHIFKRSLAMGMLPFYVIAEDFFEEVITAKEGTTYTPGSIFELIESKVANLKKALVQNDKTAALGILDPRGKILNNSPGILNAIIEVSKKTNFSNLPIVLMVDELEGQYGVLRDKTQTKDRSPLRDWLESKSYLKFLAFAPAGIYELGGADRDRVKRIVLPAADTDYVRKVLIQNAGLSNACWWVSRGKARQLFKAYEVLSKLKNDIDADRAARILKHELDYIGQPPTQVPPAVLSAVEPSKTPYLLNLCPIEGESRKRYVIDIAKLQTGQLADKLIDAFNISKDNALLISGYFKKTTKALTNGDNVTYITSEDLPELFCLVFDHLLEYEHGSPEVLGSLGEILNLYERVNKEKASLYGIIGTLWELKETRQQLPFKVAEIRKAFPFPTMNPIIKNYLPEEMNDKWVGKGLPIWIWTENGNTMLFFSSEKDFRNYAEKDEFLSLAIPDGRSALAVFSSNEMPNDRKPTINWLEQNNKFRMAELPSLLTDFLLSLSGEVNDIPGNLSQTLDSFKGNEDVLLSRKIEIYNEAIREIRDGLIPKPHLFCKGSLPDVDVVWGKGQMDREVAILGISLPFLDLTLHQKELLAEIRDLFHSGREGRGNGDLNPLMPRGGYIALCDDLFPRYGRKKELKDSEPSGRLSLYWRDEERKSLVDLARILPKNQFLSLESEENMNRLLEALWRSVRKDFEINGFEDTIQNFQTDIFPTLDDCTRIEQTAIANFQASGINFEQKEVLVKAKDSIKRLTEIALEVSRDNGEGAQYTKCILNTFMSAINENFDRDIISLASSNGSAKRALEDLSKVSENLKKNYWEYRKATKLVKAKEEDIQKIMTEQTNINGTPTMHELETSARERKEFLESISNNLGILDKKLEELKKIFDMEV